MPALLNAVPASLLRGCGAKAEGPPRHSAANFSSGVSLARGSFRICNMLGLKLIPEVCSVQLFIVCSSDGCSRTTARTIRRCRVSDVRVLSWRLQCLSLTHAARVMPSGRTRRLPGRLQRSPDPSLEPVTGQVRPALHPSCVPGKAPPSPLRPAYCLPHRLFFAPPPPPLSPSFPTFPHARRRRCSS